MWRPLLLPAVDDRHLLLFSFTSSHYPSHKLAFPFTIHKAALQWPLGHEEEEEEATMSASSSIFPLASLSLHLSPPPLLCKATFLLPIPCQFPFLYLSPIATASFISPQLPIIFLRRLPLTTSQPTNGGNGPTWGISKANKANPLHLLLMLSSRPSVRQPHLMVIRIITSYPVPFTFSPPHFPFFYSSH
jgi:hypothetical protein